MHPDYDHFVHSITFQKMQIPATNQYFSIKPTVAWVKILERKTSVFPVRDLVATG